MATTERPPAPLELFKRAVETSGLIAKLKERALELSYNYNEYPQIQGEAEELLAEMHELWKAAVELRDEIFPYSDAESIEQTSRRDIVDVLIVRQLLLDVVHSYRPSDVREQLRVIRVAENISTEELGRRLKLTGGAIRHIEAGRRSITLDRIEEWANACRHAFLFAFVRTQELKGAETFLDLRVFKHGLEANILTRLFRAFFTKQVPPFLMEDLLDRVELVERAIVKKK